MGDEFIFFAINEGKGIPSRNIIVILKAVRL